MDDDADVVEELPFPEESPTRKLLEDHTRLLLEASRVAEDLPRDRDDVTTIEMGGGHLGGLLRRTIRG